ncbi:hypothetical protein ACWT_0167 [Actinoplanes sp. SE50]|uniref:hypothetical protein n=1 Tax=unclassified Actinoplanes TaxID=2626549 RepID=UPI00023ED537|nr:MULTISPECIES: hypothetical protein [unclassified Actinoplanes]AEV81181.1 hypothetical protein ACPL_282 [Actinoplanes sp. SE50/110]ATO79582.1 hypothetical protein ACWT_0167 [Actinoplanes sp. SE50]SLL96984.1 hypothetical protein ACSP50_0180 [Actinoplanes sp. SE50/110]
MGSSEHGDEPLKKAFAASSLFGDPEIFRLTEPLASLFGRIAADQAQQRDRFAKLIGDITGTARARESLSALAEAVAADQAQQHARLTEMAANLTGTTQLTKSLTSIAGHITADQIGQRDKLIKTIGEVAGAAAMDKDALSFMAHQVAADQAQQRARLSEIAADLAGATQFTESLTSTAGRVFTDQAGRYDSLAQTIGPPAVGVRLTESLTSPLGRMAVLEPGQIEGLARACRPNLDDLAESLSTVITQINPDLTHRTVSASVDVLQRIVADGLGEESLDQLADEVTASSGYADLWRDIQTEVKTVLQEAGEESGHAGVRDAAAWHISWLWLLLRESLPTVTTVEKISKVVSISTVAFICCAVLRTTHPKLWADLEELQLTPFDFVGYLFGVLAWAETQKDRS